MIVVGNYEEKNSATQISVNSAFCLTFAHFLMKYDVSFLLLRCTNESNIIEKG